MKTTTGTALKLDEVMFEVTKNNEKIFIHKKYYKKSKDTKDCWIFESREKPKE